MNKLPTCYGIIPARYQSTRFPGKPLADILGKPMFWHVFKQASLCPELESVVLATDDERILSAAKKLDVPVVMTKENHHSGTDRVLEAAESIKVPRDAVVINIQGDEPALNPAVISELIVPFKNPEVHVTTPARKITMEEAQSPHMVKVVFTMNQKALYFSRSSIPHPRENQQGQFYGHIGLYAFRMSVLQRFVALPPGRLERIEKLEQLRFLENDIPVQVMVTTHRSIGVDRPGDIEKVSKLLKKENNSGG
ncbi:MAG: 3-deoxy-manno-octulosonate cytidylyltransferase [Thermodesulfobacteriota bacterium]|nr:3-deoxy-manno-octulosonate cytidylyltransferase [Thermodesulfobacteriota bacterium]